MLPVFVVAEGCHVAILYLLSWKRSCKNNGKKGIKNFIRPLYLKTFRRPSPLWYAWHSWPRKITITPGGPMNGTKWRSGFLRMMQVTWLPRKTVTWPERLTNYWNQRYNALKLSIHPLLLWLHDTTAIVNAGNKIIFLTEPPIPSAS